MLIIPQVEQEDVQSLLFEGYPKLEAIFFLLWVADREAAQAGLGELKVRYGNKGDPEAPAVQIAFTAKGLEALGVDREVLGGFSLPFRDGMDSEHRSRVLGDVGANGPGNWRWGRSGAAPPTGVPHAILLIYAKPEQLGQLAKEQLDLLKGWHFDLLEEPLNLRADNRKQLKEHFGFDDGIGNPYLRGVYEDSPVANTVAVGEFVLGYVNEAGLLPASPHVPPGAPGGHVLPNGDFGRNGSYLVVRQLEQDVPGFWRFIVDQSQGNADQAIGLAAKMVGRWPNGAPLALWAKQPSDAEPIFKNDEFLYSGDPHGHGCPIGAHIRRANPRDSVPLLDPARSLATSNQRRILRRGRTYGRPVRGWPDDPKQMAEASAKGSRGLHFLCFVADLERQYEFVQQTWINSRKFAGLGNDADPLLSNPELPPNRPPKPSDFTIQHGSLNQRVMGLPNFVTVQGSAYFFMPGSRAIAYLSEL